jgi:hypothetical protein
LACGTWLGDACSSLRVAERASEDAAVGVAAELRLAIDAAKGRVAECGGEPAAAGGGAGSVLSSSEAALAMALSERSGRRGVAASLDGEAGWCCCAAAASGRALPLAERTLGEALGTGGDMASAPSMARAQRRLRPPGRCCRVRCRSVGRIGGGVALDGVAHGRWTSRVALATNVPMGGGRARGSTGARRRRRRCVDGGKREQGPKRASKETRGRRSGRC